MIGAVGTGLFSSIACSLLHVYMQKITNCFKIFNKYLQMLNTLHISFTGKGKEIRNRNGNEICLHKMHIIMCFQCFGVLATCKEILNIN